MKVETFRSAIRTRPFQVFTVKTASGETYTVRHPELVAISSTGQSVGLFLDEAFAVLDMESITEFVVTRDRPRETLG